MVHIQLRRTITHAVFLLFSEDRSTHMHNSEKTRNNSHSSEIRYSQLDSVHPEASRLLKTTPIRYPRKTSWKDSPAETAIALTGWDASENDINS